MYFVRFRQYALRWDLPERFVAGIGVLAVSISAILAGISQQIHEKHWDEYGFGPSPTSWFDLFSLTTIGLLYLCYMLGTAWFIASKPHSGKPLIWLIVSAALTWSFLVVAGKYGLFIFRGYSHMTVM